ncbi:MAG: GIY-YIG nuclease family protein [Pseudomonadota bacterium]
MIPTPLRREITASGIEGVWTFPDKPDEIPQSKGAYALGIRLNNPVDLKVNRLCSGHLLPGWYFYVGSARGSGGLAARLKRHFRPHKKFHWHIDRLTVHAAAMTALAVVEGNECDLAGRLLETARFKVALSGFGSTDCRHCNSHLLTTVL